MPGDIPAFAYLGTLFAHNALKYNPCRDLIFPSVVKVEGLIEKPLGKYYLYYAPHDAPGGICLAYADAPAGPWIEYESNPVITREWPPHYQVSHISSPHVLWMPEQKKFFLYFHGENDTTRLATSTDGIHFVYDRVVITADRFSRISEASYARVFPCSMPSGRGKYVMLLLGNNEGTRRIYAAWSNDGRNFVPQLKPLISPPPGTGATQAVAAWYFRANGRNLVLFHADTTKPDLSELTTEIYAVEVGADFTEEKHLGLVFARTEVSKDNQRVADPCLFEDEGVRWLFLSVGPRLGQMIALAREIPA